jgi:hypothetical protein
VITTDGREGFVAERRKGGANRVEKGSLGQMVIRQSKDSYGLTTTLIIGSSMPAGAAEISLDDKPLTAVGRPR